jgi:hypothetical protein
MSKQRKRSAKPLRAVRGGSRSRITKTRAYPKYTMYNSPRVVMPPEFDTKLKYIVQGVVTNAAGFVASIRYTNNAYDVDPTLGSTAMPGFLEFSAFYARFRTLSMRYKFSCANQEAFSLTLIHGFGTVSLASGSLTLVYAGNPLFSTTMVGPATGMNTKILQRQASVASIAGTQQALFDDLYTGSTVSSTLATAGTVYAHCGIISSAPLTALGVLITAEITLDVRFYRPFFLAA